MNRNNFFILTGSCGTGKTALISHMKKQGIATRGESAREILAEQRLIEGDGVWDKNQLLFQNLILSRSIDKYLSCHTTEAVFFDRSICDSAAYFKLAGINHEIGLNAGREYRYNQKVFFAEPWEDIYENDAERQLTFQESVTLHEHILEVYTELKYDIIFLPKVSVEQRYEFIKGHVDLAQFTKSINRNCPNSGKPVVPDSLTTYKGWTVGFCNPDCRDNFAKKPEAESKAKTYFDSLLAEKA